MAGARDSSWGGHHHALLFLDAKLSHVGADVDGLAFHLHRPTDFGCKARIQSLLTGIISSHHSAQTDAISDRLSMGVQSPCDGPRDVVLTA
jgi:hypothetical protein